MPRREGDFSPKTIRTLALRAGYLCSNPDCRHSTSGPHSDPDGFIITGEAAHICAAAEGGPRYDEKQSSEQRKAITNAIWLCGNCNKRIDTDWKAWPKERLLEMKTAHEKWISAEAMIPLPPVITLRTQPALRFSQGLKEITPEIQTTYRDQGLIIENPNRVDLFNVKLDLNLPEVIMCGGDFTIPLGIDLRLNAVDPPNQAVVRGNASVTDGQKVPTTHWTLQADKLGPGQRIVLGFYTAKPDMTMQYDLVRLNPDLNHEDPEKMDEHEVCFYFLEGKYQFLLRSEYVTGNVFVPFFFNADTRMTESRPVQTSSDPWRVAQGQVSRGADLKVGKGGLNVVWTNVVQY